MASGDAAAAQGFVPVLATDDFRLGYQRINDAADFTATRVRFYTASSDSAMSALTGMKRGDRCYRSDVDIEFLYLTSWKAWNSTWRAYQVVTSGFTVGNYQTGFLYRYVQGEVEVRFQGAVNATPAAGNPFSISVPVTAQYVNGIGNDLLQNIRGIKAGDGSYLMGVSWRDTGQVWLDTLNVATVNSRQVQKRFEANYQSPFSWANGDSVEGRFRYTPA